MDREEEEGEGRAFRIRHPREEQEEKKRKGGRKRDATDPPLGWAGCVWGKGGEQFTKK